MSLLPIIVVLFIAVFLLFFILKDLGMISKKQKILTIIAFIFIGIIIGIYAYHKSQLDKKIFLLQMSFLRGENISCENHLINSREFNLATGTLTLIGKENSSSKNIIYSLKDCELAKENPAFEKQNLQEQLEKD